MIPKYSYWVRVSIIWNPVRSSVIWFDILKQKMFEKKTDLSEVKEFDFDLAVSADGLIDENEILVATAIALEKFNLITQTREKIIDLEVENPRILSNDGRADPNGVFGIGTMGMNLEQDMGAYYRYYKRELRKIYDNYCP